MWYWLTKSIILEVIFDVAFLFSVGLALSIITGQGWYLIGGMFAIVPGVAILWVTGNCW